MNVPDSLVNKIKENLFSVVVLALAVILAVKGFQKNATVLKDLDATIAQESKKNEELRTYLKLENKMKTLQTQVNNKAIARIINNLSGYAKEASVKMVNIKPDSPKVLSVYTKYGYDLTVAAEKYHSIGRFISLLENSRDIYIVEDLFVTVAAQQVDKDKTTAKLKISTILVN